MDNDARVLERWAIAAGPDYIVSAAQRGDKALTMLKQAGGIAVVVAELRLPDMSGAALLQHVMSYWPETTRILTTAERALGALVDAINKAQPFRLLTKPSSADEIKNALEAGIRRHRLTHADHAMLKETVAGCVDAFMELLAISNPVAFARAGRLKRRASDFVQSLDYHNFWQLETAALLSQLPDAVRVLEKIAALEPSHHRS